MVSTHPLLEWPRSDGSQDNWPSAEQRWPSSTHPWYELLPKHDKKWDLYRSKVGEHLAKYLRIPGDASLHKVDLPADYALFAHHTGERTDVYLYGSVNANKFRSTAEFFEHAVWLSDTSKSLNDHVLCECKYNPESEIARAKKVGSSPVSGPSTRSGALPDQNGKRRKIDEVSDEEEEGLSGIVPERQIDMKSRRRFRKGELVWFRIPTTSAPGKGSGLPSITHWPGLIASIVAKSRVLVDGNTSLRTADFLLKSDVKSAQQAPQRSITRYEYHLRPLGMFSQTDELVNDTEDLLPWAAGSDLLGGSKGWEHMGQEGTRVLLEGVVREAAEDTGPLDETAIKDAWKQRWARRMPFREMAEDWNTRAFRLGVALKTGKVITNAWTQTDKVEVMSNADINAEDLKAIMEQKQTLYQGLWWGGERIWLEDMVRLRKHRSELPADALGPPSEGAIDRAVLLNIRRAISYLERSRVDLDRCITIEVSPDNTNETTTAWRCLLYGDVYEVAKASGFPFTPQSMDMKNGELSMVQAYTAPDGFEFKQLNDPGAEVTADILDVAGRLYPNLLDSSTQKWFIDPAKPQEVEGRVSPGDSALALMGLRPGTLVNSSGVDWKEDLYIIVSEATKSVEKAMQKYYEGQVKKVRGIEAASSGSWPVVIDPPKTLDEAMGRSEAMVA